MKKSIKIISTVVAIALVLTAMIVAIYSATIGGASIKANVSWTAQAGVDLEFWAVATGGNEEKTISKKYIKPETTNDNATISGDLSCNFIEKTDDGVNNPGAITFRYFVKNNSLTPLNIRVTRFPSVQEESGTNASNHKPKVELSSLVLGSSVLSLVSSASGYNLSAGNVFEYDVTVSLASGGTATIDADTGLNSGFDAGVTFNFNVGGSESANNSITTIIDGTPTEVASSTLVGKTLGEYLDSIKTDDLTTGWFFDENLTKAVTERNLSAELTASAVASLYSKKASTTGLKFTLNSDGNSYSVAGDNPSGDIIIPSTYQGKPVTVLADSAFKDCRNLTGVVLPSTITAISYRAFFICNSLTNFVLHDNITNIDKWSFYQCTKLKNLIIPNSVEVIGSCAVAVANLESISVESGNSKYDSRNNCNAVIETATNSLILSCENTVIPNTVTSLYYGSFYGYHGTSIDIPNSVTKIENSAFSYSRITNLKIPSSIVDITPYAFSFCSYLDTIVVDEGNPQYDSRNNCNAIIESATNKLIVGTKSTVIPSSVTTIGEFSFRGRNGRNGLETIVIPNNITTIEGYAFSYCEGITKIYIPASVTNIKAGAITESLFYMCKSTLKIYCEASNQPIGWSDYWNYYDSSNRLNVTWGATMADFKAG